MTTPLGVNLEYEPQQATVAVDGVNLTYETLGEGPNITAVNSAFLIAPMWRSFMTQIAQRNRVITYDMRNQGASDTDPDATWQQHVDDLGHVLDAAGAERSYLVTSSASALLCRDFALAHPDRVAGLILLGPALSPHGGGRRKAINKTWLTTLEHVGAEALWDHLWALTLSPAGIEEYGPAAYVALREAFVAMMQEPSLLSNLRAVMDADDDPQLLTRIACPTLLIVGDCDFMVGPSDLERLVELIPDCDSLYLPQVGHLPYWEGTEEFERATIEFIDRVEDARRRAMDTLPLANTTDTVRTLAVLLETASAGTVAIPDSAAAEHVPLRSLGIDSIGYLAFMSAIEDAFGVSWAYDEPAEAFETLGTIAVHLRDVKAGGR